MARPIGITDEAINDLIGFLDCHEDDIAIGINDFSSLRSVFEFYMGRKAETMDHLGRVIIDGKRTKTNG